MLQGVSVSKMPSRGKPKLCGVSISALGAEVSKVMSSIGPTAHQGVQGNWFKGDAWKDVKGMSRDNVREVRDYSNAVPGVRSLISRGVNGWGRMRKSRGRVRT